MTQLLVRHILHVFLIKALGQFTVNLRIVATETFLCFERLKSTTDRWGGGGGGGGKEDLKLKMLCQINRAITLV